jgi:hypothetical protein
MLPDFPTGTTRPLGLDWMLRASSRTLLNVCDKRVYTEILLRRADPSWT